MVLPNGDEVDEKDPEVPQDNDAAELTDNSADPKEDVEIPDDDDEEV